METENPVPISFLIKLGYNNLAPMIKLIIF